MYCRYCAKQISDKAVVCSGCGRAVGEPGEDRPSSGEGWNIFLMIGLMVLTLFAPPVGLVFGIIGLRDEGKKVQGAVLTTMSIFLILLLTAIIMGL